MYSIFNNRAFTLLEIMIVLAIIGLLAAALFPSYTSYLERGRDSTRITDIDLVAKSLALYYSENDAFPTADANGCVNDSALSQYNNGKPRLDPLTGHYNGCTPGKYGYGMSTGIITNPHVFSLLAIMEQPYSGNYSGGLLGFTGALTLIAYNSGLTETQKGNGQYYVRVP